MGEKLDALVPADLLEMLCCPIEACRKPFVEDHAKRELVCQGCGRRYPVDDAGTPNLLPEAGRVAGRD